MNTVKVVCICGAEITDENIYYSNHTNEEGEEYYNVSGDCECGKEYSDRCFGNIYDMDDAKERLVDIIKSEK